MSYKVDKQIKIYEQHIVFDVTGTGIGEDYFYVVSGSRMLITTQVTALSSGATVLIELLGAISVDDPYTVIGSYTVSSATTKRQSFPDINKLLAIRYTVIGGSATFKTAMTIHDNAVEGSGGSGGSGFIVNEFDEFDLTYDIDDNLTRAQLYLNGSQVDDIVLSYNTNGDLIHGTRS